MLKMLNYAARCAAILGCTVYVYERDGTLVAGPTEGAHWRGYGKLVAGLTEGALWRGYKLVAAVQPEDAA